MPPISVIETAPPYTEHHAKAGQTVTFTTEDGITVSITGRHKGRGGEIIVSSEENTINTIVPADSDIPVFRQSSRDVTDIILEVKTT